MVADGNDRFGREALFWSLVVGSGMAALSVLIGFWESAGDRAELHFGDDELRPLGVPAITAIGCGLFLAWLAERCRNASRMRVNVARAEPSPESLPLLVPWEVARTDPLERIRRLTHLRRHREACEANGRRRCLGATFFGTCIGAALLGTFGMFCGVGAQFQTGFTVYVEEAPDDGTGVLVCSVLVLAFGLLVGWCSWSTRDAGIERSRLRELSGSGQRDPGTS